MRGVRLVLAALAICGCCFGIASAQSTVSVSVNPGTFIPGSTTITYTTDNAIPADSYVNIFDEAGHVVRTIYGGNRSAGTYMVPWNGKDNRGVRVPDGTYTVNVSLYRFDAGTAVQKTGQWGNYGRTAATGYGIAANATGYLYVTEYTNNVVQVYDPAGNYLTQFGSAGSGNGQFNNPRGIAINATGYVYVVDQSNRRVEVFDQNGNYLTKFGSYGSGDGQLKTPYGVAINAMTGYVYVANSGNYRVEVFDAGGNYVTKFGSYMSDVNDPQPGQFLSVYGIAINSTGYVYAVDNSYGQVQIFDAAGNCLNNFWATADTDYGLRSPVAIGVNSSGNVFVTDTYTGNNNVVIFDADGNYLSDFGSYGTGTGQFWNPTGLTLGSVGNVYVVDQTNGRMQRFDAAGNFLSTFAVHVPDAIGLTYVPIGMDINATGCVYVADSGNNRIEVFDGDGSYVTKFGSYGSGDGQLSAPMDVTLNSTGYIYVADTNNDRIEVFDGNGNYVSKFGTSGSGAGQLNRPSGIAFNSTGYIFVTNIGSGRGTKVEVFDPGSNFLTEFRGGLYGAVGVGVNSSDFTYVTDTWFNNVEVFDPSGRFVANVSAGFNRPYSIAFDRGDNLYVSGRSLITVLDRNGTMFARFGDGVYYSDAVAVDSSGIIYITDEIWSASNGPGVVKYGFSADYAADSAPVIVTGTGQVKNLRTGFTYGTIQAAIDDTATFDGDMITVNSGAYDENVLVDKALNLTGIDTGSGLPKVNGRGSTAITVSADHVKLQGFNATGGDDGIYVTGDYCNVTGNIACGNTNYGIRLFTAHSSRVLLNTAYGNSKEGIFVSYSDDCVVDSNTARNNVITGIEITMAENCTAAANVARDNRYGMNLTWSEDSSLVANTATNDVYGFFLASLTNCNATSNIARYCTDGMWLTWSNYDNMTNNTARDNTHDGIFASSVNGCNLTANTARDNGNYGISLSYSNGLNNLTSNIARNNSLHGIFVAGPAGGWNLINNTASWNSRVGIYLSSANGNNLTANTVTGNARHGIYLYYSGSNNVTANTVRDNAQNGIYVSNAASNVIWLNVVTGNTANALATSAGANSWNSTAPRPYAYGSSTYVNYTGNYWGDYSGPDANGDGIGDTAYAFATGGVDKYPMLLTAPPATGPVKNLRTGLTYASIQAAIDATDTLDGDTITVDSGTYRENVEVDKSLNITGIDTGTGMPTVDAGGWTWSSMSHAINVTADDVVLCGLNVTNAYDGIWVYDADNVRLAGNKMVNDCEGICVLGATNSVLTGNLAVNCLSSGMFVVGTNVSICDNTVYGSNFTGNNNAASDEGISVQITGGIVKNNYVKGAMAGISIYTGNTTVTANRVWNNTQGINIGDSCDNNVTANTAAYNQYGIWVEGESNYVSDNLLTGNVNGIFVEWQWIKITVTDGKISKMYPFCTNNTLINNTAKDGTYGLFFLSGNNNATRNNVTDNQYGIFLNGITGANVTANNVSNNRYGICSYYASDNVIWLNRFRGNGADAYLDHSGANRWNSTVPLSYKAYDGTIHVNYTGNYWGDYSGPDANADGIGDMPVMLNSTNVDRYPMLLATPAVTGPVKNLRTGLTYSTIQAAIDATATLDGDTITVDSGTYPENVKVCKSLVLTGIDTGSGKPVVDGSGKVAINVTANGVTIRGFNATNGSTGIRVVSRYNVITDNLACNNTDTGIRVGLNFYPSSNNTITDNIASDNMGWAGIELYNSSYCYITGNTADNNSNGILLGVSSHCNVSGNTGRYNDAGLYVLYSSDYANVTGNTFDDNTNYGIQFYGSNYCNLTGNTVRDNTIYGVFLGSSAGNIFWLNVIGGNGANAYIEDALGELWNSTSSQTYTYAGFARSNYTGNYWGDYTGPDANADGIGDNPYVINANNIDRYPMLVTAPILPAANFFANATTGTAPMAVQFTDTSTGSPTGWSWDFGDSGTSHGRNPVHRYDAAGIYTVTLTATNANGTDIRTENDYITVTAPIPVVAGFTSNVTTGVAPLYVQFNDTSTGEPTGWQWSFGDGSSNLTARNATHNFTGAGTFTVYLTVTNGLRSGTTSHVITVLSPTVPVAGFTTNVTSGMAPMAVRFTDASTVSPTSWAWEFGDGDVSTNQNPVHLYSTPGVYPVTLMASNANGSNTLTKSNYIIVNGNAPDHYTISLKQGWNLISLPLVNDSINVSCLASIGISRVAQYNVTTHNFDVFIMGRSPDDYNLTIDVGYFLYATEDTDFDVWGDAPDDRSIQLSPGWNLIGWSSPNMSTSDIVAMSITGTQRIARYNTLSHNYDVYIEDRTPDSFVMKPTEGYFIYTAELGTLSYRYAQQRRL